MKRKKVRSINPIKTAAVGMIVLSMCTVFLSAESAGQMEPNQLVQNSIAAEKYFVKGFKDYSKKKYDEALDHFKKCINQYPLHADAYYYLSQIHYIRNDVEKALGFIKQAKATQKKFFEIKGLKKQKNIKVLKENLANMRKELEFKSTGGRQAQLRQAMIDTRMKIDKLNEDYKDFLADNARIVAGYYYLHGNIDFRLKKFQEAHDQYIETIKIEPTFGPAYNNLANLYYLLKDYKTSMMLLKKAESNGIKINPEFKMTLEKALVKN